MDWLIDQKITCLFFGYCIVLHLLYCIPPLFAAQDSVIQDACEPKKKINGTISDMQNPIDHTNQVSANKHKSALNYGHSKNVCIYDLIGNNIFMEECTRDNINN